MNPFPNSRLETTKRRAKLVALVRHGWSPEGICLETGYARSSLYAALSRAGLSFADIERARRERGFLPERWRLKKETQQKKPQTPHIPENPDTGMPPHIRDLILKAIGRDDVTLGMVLGRCRRTHILDARWRAVMALYYAYPGRSLSWHGSIMRLGHQQIAYILRKHGVKQKITLDERYFHARAA